MIETDRLLELIDQFAAAEGRMKWAPNKKLHFEVAVIKAIQTLSQVTLNEVIENLAALRDGSAVTSVRSVAKTLRLPSSHAGDRKRSRAKAEKPVARAASTRPLPADRRTKALPLPPPRRRRRLDRHDRVWPKASSWPTPDAR